MKAPLLQAQEENGFIMSALCHTSLVSASQAHANILRHTLWAAKQPLVQKFFNFSSFYYFSKTEASTSAQTGVGKKKTPGEKTNNAVNNSKAVC